VYDFLALRRPDLVNLGGELQRVPPREGLRFRVESLGDRDPLSRQELLGLGGRLSPATVIEPVDAFHDTGLRFSEIGTRGR
jgi:hypothetical protein